MDNILSDLIAFKTFEGNPEKKSEVLKLYKYICDQLPDKYQTKLFELNNSQSLIIYSKSLKNPKIVLQAHVDVIPADIKQFKAKKIGDKLFGRGSSDMKFAIVAYIKLLQELESMNLDFAVWLTDDEEIGGFDGVNYLLNKQKLSTSLCILPDGVNNYSLVTEAKGVLHLKIETKGISSHGSLPWQGKNAIDDLINIYQELKINKLFKNSNNHWNNTINLGKISGGESANSVPETALAVIDIRFINSTNYKKILQLINKLQKKYNFNLTKLVEGSAYQLDKKSPYIKSFIDEIKKNKVPFQFNKDHGSSDARFFTDKNIDVLMFKPISDGDHSSNEWIDLNSLDIFYNILKSFVIMHAKVQK